MNPFEWLKALYGWLGVPYPKVSLFAVMILGAVLGGACWKFAGYLYAKDHPVVAFPPAVNTTNTTSGADSPITTGNENNLEYKNSTPENKKAVHPKKESSP